MTMILVCLNPIIMRTQMKSEKKEQKPKKDKKKKKKDKQTKQNAVKDLLVDDLAETQIHGNNSNLEEKFIENLVFNDTDKITKEE